MRFRMNKRGVDDTGIPNFIDILIAVMGLLIVAAIAYGLYNFFQPTGFENAQEIVKGLNAKIEMMEEGENTFVIRGIDDWYLVGWDKNEEGRPDSCFNQHCLCVCEDPRTCLGNRVCEELDRSVEVFSEPYEIERRGVSTIDRGVHSRRCIKLDEKLFDIRVTKGVDLISISYDGLGVDLELDKCDVYDEGIEDIDTTRFKT